MAKDNSKKSKQAAPPVLSMEAWENRLISLSMQEVEKRILDGTATSQMLVHYLKLGSSKGRLENALLEKEMELKQAKTKMIQSSENVEKLYNDAMEALKSYRSGT